VLSTEQRQHALLARASRRHRFRIAQAELRNALPTGEGADSNAAAAVPPSGPAADIARLRNQEIWLESALQRTRQHIAAATGAATASATAPVTTAAPASSSSDVVVSPPGTPPIRPVPSARTPQSARDHAAGALSDLELASHPDDWMLDEMAAQFEAEQARMDEDDEDEDDDDEEDGDLFLGENGLYRRRRRRRALDGSDSEPRTSDDEREDPEQPLFDDIRLSAIDFPSSSRPARCRSPAVQTALPGAPVVRPPLCASLPAEWPLNTLEDYRRFNAHVREHNHAIKDVTAIFYNEEHNEIYTGNKLGYIHVWKQ